MDAEVWQQAKGVLADALLRPPAERDAWLLARCADSRLRREVQSYLHDYDDAFLETVLTVSHTFDTSTPAAEALAPDIDAGVNIGRYVVLDRLGAGGMGRVYLGDDTGLHRKVALKCLIASGSAGDLRAKILHEAQSAARINHPNIAVVHDVVEHDGQPFLVMEYVEGESLAAVLRRGRPPIEKILAMGRQLASALSAAHAKGIIHRDLKPANIQVTPDGSVKILDFGVAQAMSVASIAPAEASTTAGGPGGATSGTLRSKRGGIVHPGTPAYMSPEQMFGQPIDQRSDIYSLGVVLFEMATGHRPYSADNPLDVVLAFSRSLLRPTGIETHLSPQVSEVITKMLAVKADDRYQSAAEVEAAIAALIAPDPTLAAPRPGARSRIRVALRVAAIAASVPLVVTSLGFLTTVWFNFALERRSPFSNESWWVWVEMGFRSLLTPVVICLGALFFVGGLKFLLRILTLSSTVDSLVTASRSQTRRLSSRLSLDNPVVAAQAVAALGAVGLVAVLWWFYGFLLTAGMPMSTTPDISGVFNHLAPYHRDAAGNFRIALELLAMFLVLGLFQIMRLRARQAVRVGVGSLSVVIALLALTIVSAEFPYRLVWHNNFERISVGGDRCYAIGQSGIELLAFCPDAAPPRNRRMNVNDPLIVRSGLIENIFTPAAPSQ